MVGVGATVRAEAARRGLTQAALSRAIGVPHATLSRRLRGLSPFTVTEIIAVAAALDLPVSALITAEPLADAV